METQARYGVIGIFTLAVIVAGFLFVYWLHTTGGVGEQAVYRVRFQGSVAGLRTGSGVLFNGLKVGEVTALRLDPQDSRKVVTTISVEKSTPVTTDTRVGVEVQGLMGSPSVALVSRGGTTPLAAGGMLEADPAASATLTASAGDVLKRLDGILVENAEPLHNTLSKISVFADALARNSERLDNIAAGLERMVGGAGAKKAPLVFDLTVPKEFPGLTKEPTGRITVGEPTALVVFDTQKILLSPEPGERTPLEDGQWSDSIPKMLQSKIIQSFENANFLNSISRPLDMGTAEFQLAVDVRNFQIALKPAPTAEIELTAKIMGEDGKIVAARIFRAAVPVTSAEAQPAAGGLAAAFAQVASEMVAWANEAI